MKKSVWILLLLIILSPAIPAAAQPVVVFEPEGANFITGMPFADQPTLSVDVSISGDDRPVRAIRFKNGSTKQDIAADYGLAPGYETGLLVSADLAEGGGKLTFSGAVPAHGWGGISFTVYLYAEEDANEESFIASGDLNTAITARYLMDFGDAPAFTAGEPGEIVVDVAFADNLTGEDSRKLPLKTLTLAESTDPSYTDLGLTITPDPATCTIRISADKPVTGEALLAFAAESDAGTVEESGLVIRVAEHTLTFSTPDLLADVTEAIDCYVAFEKKPASTPLSGLDVVMTIAENDDGEGDEPPAFAPLSSDTGSLIWNGLTIDLEAANSRLHVHGTAREQWVGELTLEAFRPDGGGLVVTSDTLGVAALQFEEGELIDFENAALTVPGGGAAERMVLNGENTLTIPLKGDPDDNDVIVTMRTPSGVDTRVPESSVSVDARKLVIRYTPKEAGDYRIEAAYVVDDLPYRERGTIGAGSTSSGGGCASGAFALLLAALIPLGLRKR